MGFAMKALLRRLDIIVLAFVIQLNYNAVDLQKTVKIAKKIQFNNNIQVKRRCTSEKKPDTESFNLSKFNAAFAFVADSEYGS